MKRILKPLLILVSCSIFAQHPGMPVIVPPSPNASALGVYADVPVSKYSGIPSIEIPLYTINVNEFSLPISLSYFASGIKVAQEASSVGLGWALNVGGVITREIRRKDDLKSDGFVNAPKVPEQGENIDSYMNELGGYGYYNLTPWDTEPDIFSFNFVGYSGKFMFTQNGDIVLLKPESALNISYVTGGFEITAPNGIVYRFFDLEATRSVTEQSEYRNLTNGTAWQVSNYSPEYGPTNISSWFLSEISLLTGETITFDYISSASKSLTKINWYTASGQSDVRTRTSTENSPELYLEKITWTNGHIDFTSSLREDIKPLNSSNPLKIDGLSLFDNNDNLMKSYAFDYSYFNEGLVDASQKYEYWRLKLNSITELSNIGNEKPPYTFGYTAINGYGYDLPSKKSVSTDFWGYFNGQPNTDEYGDPMYLAEYEKVFDNADNTYLYYPGANKKCYPEYLQMGVLKQIKYPTGNITQFEYEPNSYEDYDAYDYRYTESTVQAKACNYAYCNYWGNPNDLQTTDVQEFYIEPNTFSKKRVFITAFSENFAASFPEPQGSYGNLSKITGENGSVEKLISNFGYGNGLTNAEPCTGGGPCYCAEVNKRFYLSPGWYRLTLTPDTDLYAEATITIQNRTEDRERQGAGLRIAKIIDDSKVRNFDYTFSSGFISGVLLFKPNYNYWFSSADPYTNVGYAFQNYFGDLGLNTNLFQAISLHDNSGNLIPQGELLRYTYNTENFAGGSSGSTVGYREVTETISDQGGNLSSTKSNFSSQSSSPISPFVPIMPKWNNGLIQSESYFVNSKIVKETSTVYQLDTDTQQSVRGLAFSDTYFYFYDVKTEWGKLISTSTSLNYDSNELNPITSSTNYFYDNPTHFQLTRTETTNSDGKSVLTKTFYPDDIKTTSTLQDNSAINGGSLSSMSFSAIARMKEGDLHQIALPIQTETTVKDINNTIISSTLQRTNYSEPYLNIVLPKDIQTLKGTYDPSTNKLQDRILFNNYYTNGNLKEVTKAEGTHIVYIWGYGGQYPIAKIENATYETGQPTTITAAQQTLMDNAVNATVNETSGTTESTLRSKLQLLRDGFPNATVSTYTYDPLIGVTSITDPKGYTTYYEYDDFNRLKQVKDAAGKILSENEYNYKQ